MLYILKKYSILIFSCKINTYCLKKRKKLYKNLIILKNIPTQRKNL